MSNDIKYKVAVFLITIEALFITLAVLMMNNIQDIYYYIFLGTTLIIFMIGMINGILWSLITSMLSVFLFGSIFIYQRIFTVSTQVAHQNSSMDYAWLIIFPIIGYSAGTLGNIIKSTFEKAEMNNKYLEEYGCVDTVTNLRTTKLFYADLKKEIENNIRYGYTFSVVLMKLKYYDEFISIYGHSKMEVLRKKISSIMLEELRTSDEVYQIDKDTFGIILPATGQTGADIAQNRLREKMKTIELENDKKINDIFKLEFQINGLEYDDPEINPIEFKKMLEKELVYDV